MTLSQAARKVSLRLDNGALIGDGVKLQQGAEGAVLVLPEQLLPLGKVREADVQRLEGFIQQVQTRLPEPVPLVSAPSLGLKRGAADAGQALNGTTPAKRQRTANGHGLQDAEAGSPGASHGSWAVGEFEEKCSEVLQHVLKTLGADAVWFTQPVDGRQVRDYYSIVTNPMDLGKIKTNLETHAYSSPQEFYEDMHLVWSNAILYNGKLSVLGKTVTRVEAAFEQVWAASGLSQGTRARRATAGVAARKYEPLLGPPEKKLKRSKSIASRGQPGTARSGGAARSKSFGSKKDQPMPYDRMQEIANMLGQLDGEELQGAIEIIKASTGASADDGEVEVDFDALDSETLWKLDSFLRQLQGDGGGGGFQVEQNSDSDSDSDSDDD